MNNANRESTTAGVQTTDGQDLINYGKRLLAAGAIVLLVVAVTLTATTYSTLRNIQTEDSIDYIRINKSIQSTVTIICGMVVIYLGVALSWAGIRGSISGDVDSESFSASINTASPGIVMMICGTILIGIAVTRSVSTNGDGFDVYQKSSDRVRDVRNLEKGSKDK